MLLLVGQFYTGDNMPVYTSQYFGGVPTVSVATFGDLPASVTTDKRIAITGESALFDTTNHPAVVRWSGSVWELESCAATYLNIAAVEFASGTWTGTGGTVGTRSGARIVDTTYNESWVWNSANSLFAPSYLGGISIADAKRIKGDSLTLETGWSSTVTATNGSLTTDGSKLTFYANGTTSTTNVSVVSYSDASRTTTSNFYMKCLAQRTVSGNWNQSTTGQLTFYLQYVNGPTTGRIVEFGDADISDAAGTSFTGKFIDRTGTIAQYSATANRGDVLTTETLLQFRIIAGVTAQVKVGNGAWHDIAVSTCRFVSGGTTFAWGVSASNNVSNKAEGKLRYLQAIRYT